MEFCILTNLIGFAFCDKICVLVEENICTKTRHKNSQISRYSVFYQEEDVCGLGINRPKHIQNSNDWPTSIPQ